MIQIALVAAIAISSFAATNVAERISQFVPIQLSPATTRQLSGRYVDSSSAVRSQAGPALAGTELHLFPDGTYIHAEWADVLPLTIDDMGRWRLDNGVIRLQSGTAITWQVRHERELVAVQRRGQVEVLLIGPEQLRHFEQHARDHPDDPGLVLLRTTLALVERYGPTKAAAVHRQLLNSAWNPDFYRQESGPPN